MPAVNTRTPYLKIKSILLAEDDSDGQEFITESLLNIDGSLTIDVVSNGNDVLRFLQTCTDAQLPHLLILDYNLPERDGAEVLQMLTQHKRYNALPKIVWSTSNALQHKDHTLALGAMCYMVKPSTITGIEAIARQMLTLCHTTV